MENKQGKELTSFQAWNEREFKFFSPYAITSLPASEFEIIDNSILQDLIPVSRCSYCNNRIDRIGQVRKGISSSKLVSISRYLFIYLFFHVEKTAWLER